MSEIKTATVEEVKAEENTAYVPAELVTVEVDKLAEEFIKNAYTRWLATQGARVAKEAKAKEEAQAEIAKLRSEFDQFSASVDKANAKLAQAKDWAAIARNEADKEAKAKELDKAIKKLEGQKVRETGSKDGALTVAKLDWSEIRKTVFQVKFAGKAFVVAHSSMVNSNTVKAGADNYLIVEVQPVDVIKHEDGSKEAQGIPTLVGKPMLMVVEPGRQGTLTHSGFTNGIAKFARTNKLAELSEKTAYQPWAIEAKVVGAEYSWLVVKE